MADTPVTVLKMRHPTREICKRCWRESTVGFGVPDAIWLAAVGEFDGVLCLDCFTRAADAKLIRWDEAIEFYPVSLRTHLSFSASLRSLR